MECYVCKKEIEGNFRRFCYSMYGDPSIEVLFEGVSEEPLDTPIRVFYTHYGYCTDKFFNNLNEIMDDELPINNRFEILDL
jgi:hypothetical protein